LERKSLGGTNDTCDVGVIESVPEFTVDDDEFEFVETAGRQLGESESADERVE
jgi:hypothetical protein|tara:strand:- start:704 stop:862 length:159 start_codon:yes stop_codon:yes gene_type:complete